MASKLRHRGEDGVRSPRGFSTVVTALGLGAALSIAALGCAVDQTSPGTGSAPAGAPATPTALGVYPASPSMKTKYGIAEWRTYYGKTQLVVTGYKPDGTAARGVQLAWFKPVPGGAAGHTRLTMLDGTKAAIRRMTDGTRTGMFSADQVELFQTMRYDLARASAKAVSGGKGAGSTGAGIHVLDDPMMGTSSAPDTGPACTSAWTDPQMGIDAVSCGYGAATFETVIGGVVAVLTCAQWYAEVQNAKAECSKENSASCNDDTPPTCNYGGSSGDAGAPAMPEAACDTACLCANYPQTAQGCGTVGPCSYDSDCGMNESCQSAGGSGKTCQPKPVQPDNPSDGNTSSQGSSPSCPGGDVSADASNGQTGCSMAGGASSSSSGTPAAEGSPSPSAGNTANPAAVDGPDPTGMPGTDPGSTPGNPPAATCASDGESCGQSSDCCNSPCNNGTCGATPDADAGGGPACAAEGAACAQDSECCGGSCTSGACGAAPAPDPDAGGATCAADGAACARDSECCNGSCTGGTCGAPAAACASSGAGCAQDSDCCSGSCDQMSGTCT